MTVVDYIAIVLIVLGALWGFKKGAIKTLVQLVGLVAITIVAYQFKDVLGNLMIRHFPFFNFGGHVNELYALNLLFYQGIAFILVFILLYCLLNILIDLSGVLDLILKFTIIFELPSKLIGAVLGAVEMIFFIFIVGVSMLQFNQTNGLVMGSKVLQPIVERTPVVNMIFRPAIGAAENIYQTIEEYQENQNVLETNVEIIRLLKSYEIVGAEIIQECIDNGKLHMENVVIA